MNFKKFIMGDNSLQLDYTTCLKILEDLSIKNKIIFSKFLSEVEDGRSSS